MNDRVLRFIQKRFKNDCNWTTGNCYYFAVILKERFPNGKIYYDVVNGHFAFQYQNKFYDWSGIVELDGCLVEWDKFQDYDSLQYARIMLDCIY